MVEKSGDRADEGGHGPGVQAVICLDGEGIAIIGPEGHVQQAAAAPDSDVQTVHRQGALGVIAGVIAADVGGFAVGDGFADTEGAAAVMRLEHGAGCRPSPGWSGQGQKHQAAERVYRDFFALSDSFQYGK